MSVEAVAVPAIYLTTAAWLDLAAFFFAPYVYPVYATVPTAARIPIIATTTSNSIRVKPLMFFI